VRGVVDYKPKPRAEIEKYAEMEAMGIHSAKKTAPLVRAYVHGYMAAFDRASMEFKLLLDEHESERAD
jgi:hypothetical protein